MITLKLFFFGVGLIFGALSAIGVGGRVDLWKLGWVSVGISLLV